MNVFKRTCLEIRSDALNLILYRCLFMHGRFFKWLVLFFKPSPFKNVRILFWLWLGTSLHFILMALWTQILNLPYIWGQIASPWSLVYNCIVWEGTLGVCFQIHITSVYMDIVALFYPFSFKRACVFHFSFILNMFIWGLNIYIFLCSSFFIFCHLQLIFNGNGFSILLFGIFIQREWHIVVSVSVIFN